MHKSLALIVTASLALLAGCANNQVNERTLTFWQAVQQEQFADAARLTIDPSPTKLRILTAPLRDRQAEVIDSKVEGNKAVVLTKLSNDNTSEYIMTILVNHEDQWLIDDQSMLQSALSNRLNQLTDEVSDGANQLLDEAMQELEASWDQVQQSLENR